jgi:hypothetical protein
VARVKVERVRIALEENKVGEATSNSPQLHDDGVKSHSDSSTRTR